MNGQNGQNGQYPPAGMPMAQPQYQQQPQQQYQQMPPQQYAPQPMPQQYAPPPQQYAPPPQAPQGQGYAPTPQGQKQEAVPGVITIDMNHRSIVEKWGDGAGGPVLPDGTKHDFEIVKAGATKDKNGNDRLKIWVRVISGTHQGKEITQSYAAGGNGNLMKLILLQRACFGAERPTFNTQDFVGFRFNAEVKHRQDTKNPESEKVFTDLVNAQPCVTATQPPPGVAPVQQQQQPAPQMAQPPQQPQYAPQPPPAQPQQPAQYVPNASIWIPPQR